MKTIQLPQNCETQRCETESDPHEENHANVKTMQILVKFCVVGHHLHRRAVFYAREGSLSMCVIREHVSVCSENKKILRGWGRSKSTENVLMWLRSFEEDSWNQLNNTNTLKNRFTTH
ncbi:hypothetical protein XENOCAPTIV_006586 [Xenoophorus captivus]|uniref:Uncharacterized protein n=1 Tax=Xenoophorus captivus TaxID=1517983 RepID=A0ABV0QLD5_9TELE